MQTIHTAPMEIFSPILQGPYESEPHEAGWATEALAIVYVIETSNNSPVLSLRAQISADGQRWIDHRAAFEPIRDVGGYYLPIEHFGNWLRLAGTAQGGESDQALFTIDFYWVLKG